MMVKLHIQPRLAVTVAVAVLAVGGFIRSALGEDAVSPKFGAGAAVQAPAETAPRRVVIRFLTDSDFPPSTSTTRTACLSDSTSISHAPYAWSSTRLAISRRGRGKSFFRYEARRGRCRHRSAQGDRGSAQRRGLHRAVFSHPGRFAGRKDLSTVDMTPSGLDGKRIAVARGTAHEAFLKAFFRDSPLAMTKRPTSTPGADGRQGRLPVRRHGHFTRLLAERHPVAPDVAKCAAGPFQPKFFGDGIAIGVPKNDPEIGHLLNKALDQVRASGASTSWSSVIFRSESTESLTTYYEPCAFGKLM